MTTPDHGGWCAPSSVIDLAFRSKSTRRLDKRLWLRYRRELRNKAQQQGTPFGALWKNREHRNQLAFRGRAYLPVFELPWITVQRGGVRFPTPDRCRE